jgi:signal transduction histidine kinase
LKKKDGLHSGFNIGSSGGLDSGCIVLNPSTLIGYIDELIAAIERNAHAQTRLIDDLLDVSRAISGKLRLEPRPVQVTDAVRAAIDTVAPARVRVAPVFTAGCTSSASLRGHSSPRDKLLDVEPSL